MIALIAAGPDENPSATCAFSTVAQPVGVVDGSLLVIAIAVDAANVTVTPPNASWTLATRTDPARGVALWVWWKFALNEPPRWVFPLSVSVKSSGGVVCYANTDGWAPLEVAVGQYNASAASAAVPGVSTSACDEEILAVVASSVAGTFTPAAGFVAATSSASNGAFAMHQKHLASVAQVAPFSVGLSTTAITCSVAIVLRPTAAQLTLDDVQGLLVGALPANANRVYDLDPGGDYYNLFRAVALTAKQVVYDLVELLQLEILPRFARYKLPDWERIFGIATSQTTQLGTIPQRQSQVTSRWREAAGLGSDAAAVSAILGPLLGYDLSTPVQTVTCDRSDLDLAHSYSPEQLETSTPSGEYVYNFRPVDGGKTTSPGARVELEWGTPPVVGHGVVLTLEAPDGTIEEVDFVYEGEALSQLRFPTVAGAQQAGIWTLTVATSEDTAEFIPTVFIEGRSTGYGDRTRITGTAIFDWGAYADPAHVAESGTPANFAAARAAIQRMAFDHTTGNLLQSLTPYPDTNAGVNSAIPDECIPTV